MAITDELGMSSTPASNTTLGPSITLDGAVMTPSQVDDAFREEMSQRAKAITRHVAKGAGTYTAARADYNQFWRCTGAVTINLAAAATLSDGWCLWIRANGGAVTIDPSGVELIDGAATLVIPDGAQALVICTGSAFFTEFNTSVVNAASVGATTPGTGAFTSLSASGTGIFTGALFGLTLSNSTGDVTNDIDIAAGWARDSTDVNSMVLASALTKRLDAAWATGTNQGGLDTGALANTTYHVHLIKRLDTGVVDVLFSTSATAPTMPTNYTLFRRIGSIMRESASIIGFLQVGDTFRRANAAVDRNSTAATASVGVALSVPDGIVVAPILQLFLNVPTSATTNIALGSAAAGAANVSVLELAAGAGDTADRAFALPPPIFFTNAGRNIYFAQTNTLGTPSASILSTIGWVDTRGRVA